jgi:hypothetical protein
MTVRPYATGDNSLIYATEHFSIAADNASYRLLIFQC